MERYKEIYRRQAGYFWRARSYGKHEKVFEKNRNDIKRWFWEDTAEDYADYSGKRKPAFERAFSEAEAIVTYIIANTICATYDGHENKAIK